MLGIYNLTAPTRRSFYARLLGWCKTGCGSGGASGSRMSKSAKHKKILLIFKQHELSSWSGFTGR